MEKFLIGFDLKAVRGSLGVGDVGSESELLMLAAIMPLKDRRNDASP